MDTQYKDRIQNIPISQIETNTLNPRKRFVEDESDALIESILSKGLLNPIIVFKRKEDNKYIILDGERRYRAFLQINNKEISCHVLEDEPDDLENISLMFHIHNVREEWTDFAIAQTLIKVIDEMGKSIQSLTRSDRLEIARITSLSEYKIKKYLVFYDYPQDIIDKFLISETADEPTKGMDPDILSEMHSPIKIIEKELPDFLVKYSKEKIIDACIDKKASDIIKTNRDFRLLTKSLNAMKKGHVRKEVIFEKLESFINELSVTPTSIFEETSETVYQVDSILKKTEVLIKEVQNLNLNQVTKDERIQIKDFIKKLSLILNNKLN
jgi:ParB family chromosome partitioning protein|tara:strand:+ start:85 stop:1062 length:978 start_codon:yes stop_codon:yes gene_type:complete